MLEVSRSPEATPSTFSRLKLAVALAAGLGLSGCAGDDNASTGPRCMEDSDCEDSTTTGGADETDGSTGGDSEDSDGSTGYEISTSTTNGTTGETDGVECVEDLDCEAGEVCDQNVCVDLEMPDSCEGVVCGENASCNGGECECDEGFSEEEGVCEEVKAPVVSDLIVGCLVNEEEECLSNAESPTYIEYTIANAQIENCEISVKVIIGPKVSNAGIVEDFSLSGAKYYGGGPAGITERITLSCENGGKIASKFVDVYLPG